MALRIKNWRHYQHYTKRNPPWVKLHISIMSSEDWVVLDDASKLLAVVCMMIASKHEGEIPASCTPSYFKRVAYLNTLPNFKPLIECGFLIDMLASDSTGKQLQADARPETETETDKYIAHAKTNGAGKTQPVGEAAKGTFEKDFLEFWSAYPKKKAKQTAHKAYAKARRSVSHETIMKGLGRAIPAWRDPQFIPYPATWLNAGSWEDEFEAKPSFRSLGIV